ncbi:hypothetical protein D6B98_03615 [Bradyrhizobium sp. LVM 105]|nr:hypothetical protein D6B98_03615 [Bradyrhizobium sp. LVM 105]
MPLSKPRGRREGRVPARTRGPLRENAHAGRTAQQHTGVANHSAFPARWSDGLCRALPGAELSFWPPSPFELAMPSARLGSRASSIRLDRSNDGQDHTVLPYARPAMSPQSSQPCRRSRKLTGETKPDSAVRLHAATGSQGLPALPAPSRADAAASTASPAREIDDRKIAPPG